MSRPTDSWITDLQEALTATASSPSLSTMASTTTRFISVGTRMIPDSSADSGVGVPDGEYDGGAKRAHLFLFEASWKDARVCFGFVGQENHRFCLRAAIQRDDATGQWYCGVQRHLVKFELVEETFYPRANEIIVFCQPSFPLALVPLDKVTMVKTTKRSIQEWSQLFKSFLEDQSDEPSDALRQIGFATTVPLKTPSKASATDKVWLLDTPKGLRRMGLESEVLEDSVWNSMLDIAWRT
jgi:hypothetical protein